MNVGTVMTESAAATTQEAGNQNSSRRRRFSDTGLGKIILWVLVGIAGFFLNEGLTWAKNKQLGSDDQLEKLAEQQKAEFKSLHEGLRQLGSAIPATGRAELKEVTSAIATIEGQNRDLIRMITLARQENDRTRQLAKTNSDINGGYDFILTENAGLQLDSRTSIGISSISRTAVVLNLSRVGAEKPERSYLYSGQSAAYVSEDGRDCRIALLSIGAAGDAASFSLLCNPATQPA